VERVAMHSLTPKLASSDRSMLKETERRKRSATRGRAPRRGSNDTPKMTIDGEMRGKGNNEKSQNRSGRGSGPSTLLSLQPRC